MNKVFKCVLIPVILVLGIAVRVAVFNSAGRPINSCGALWGIMARDIGSFGAVPACFYNEPLIGAMGIYLEFILLIFFKLNPFTNILAELFFSALYIFSSYFLGKELFGKTGAFISMTLTALPSYLVVISAVMPCANYQAVLFFQNIIFLLTYKIIYGSSKTQNGFLWIILGFVSGVALWCNFIIISCISTALLFLSIRYHKLIFLKIFLLTLVFFLAGSLLFLINKPSRAIEKICRISLDVEFFDRLGHAVVNKIPAVLGFGPINLLSIVLYIAGISYAIYISKAAFKNIVKLVLPCYGSLEIFVSFCFITAIMFSRLKFHDLEGANDFIVLYPAFVCFAAKLLIDIKKRSENYFRVVFFLFIAANIINSAALAIEERDIQLFENKQLSRVISFLKSKSIDFIYSDNVNPSIVNFLSGGLIKSGAYPAKYKNPALVLRRHGALSIAKDLKDIGLGDNVRIIGDTIILYPFNAVDKDGIKIPAVSWRGVSNFNDEEMYRAWDRDLSTRWTTNRLQEPGMYFKLDLNREELINKVTMVFNPDRYDYPCALRIEISRDGEKWECIADISHSSMNLLFSGDSPFFEDLDIRFQPKRVRFIKFTDTWGSYQYYWSIREIFVFSPAVEKVSNT